MKNQSLLNIASLFKNPHLRYPALAVAGLEIAKLWLPNHSQALDGTEKIVAFYLITVAANTAPPPPPPPPIVTIQTSTQQP